MNKFMNKFMNIYTYIFFFIIFLVIVVSIYIRIFYNHVIFQKKMLYNIAKKKSIELNKPLIVIGDPINNEYGCGDICIDLHGCKDCPISIKNIIENELIKYKSDSYVIFECGVLEVVDNLSVINEMYRITGGKENIFAFHHLKNTLYSKIIKFLYTFTGKGYVQRVVIKYPPENYYSFENI